MLEHSVAVLLTDARIDRVYVVVAPTDDRWHQLHADEQRVEFLPVGGASRAQSVANGLLAIGARAGDDDRVLVHDAARPCLSRTELARLIDEAGDDDEGGLLAIPVADTLKRAKEQRAVETVPRDELWCAQTPQLFRVAALRVALSSGALPDITDEAGAIERVGGFPRLVLGSTTNIKVTTEQDLALARAILAERKRSA